MYLTEEHVALCQRNAWRVRRLEDLTAAVAVYDNANAAKSRL